LSKYADLKVGQQIWIRARVSGLFKPGTMGHREGLLTAEIISGSQIQGDQTVTAQARGVRDEYFEKVTGE
jgi:hypothetical protein